MQSYQEYFIPIFVSNLLAIVLMLLSYHFPRVLRVIWGAVFIIAGIINLITVYNNPLIYIEGFGPTAIPFYQEIIYGPFSEYPGFYITLISIGQIIIGGMIWSKKFWFILGCLGAVIFLLAIVPLGVGSAFPSTVFMALAIIFLMRKKRKRSIFGT